MRGGRVGMRSPKEKRHKRRKRRREEVSLEKIQRSEKNRTDDGNVHGAPVREGRHVMETLVLRIVPWLLCELVDDYDLCS